MSNSENLSVLNDLPHDQLYNELLRCCGSPKFALELTNRRPFQNFIQLKEVANQIWYSLTVEEWLIAFSAHPKIGDAKALHAKFSKPNSWEGDEQSGANSATLDELSALHQLNIEYEIKNGFIFLICATGKSAGQMLEALQTRMQNDKETELHIAASEQAKIINLRLVKLLDSLSSTEHIFKAKL